MAMTSRMQTPGRESDEGYVEADKVCQAMPRPDNRNKNAHSMYLILICSSRYYALVLLAFLLLLRPRTGSSFAYSQLHSGMPIKDRHVDAVDTGNGLTGACKSGNLSAIAG